MKKVLFIIFAMFIASVCEVRAEMEDCTLDMNETTLVVSGNNVSVSGANGLTLEVYKITGEQVIAIQVESDSRTFKLNLQKGCYIIRLGKLTRKISIC